MSIHSDGGHKPRMRTYPPYGDNLEGKRSEEDGVEQRAEPPSWLPDAGHPRTGAAADLRNPEADEAAAGIADDDDDDDDAGYGFSGTTSYPALTPRLALASDDARQAAHRELSRNTLIEIALGLSIFAMVGVLGTQHPAAHLVN